MIIKFFFAHYHNWDMNHRNMLYHRRKEKEDIYSANEFARLAKILPAEQTINYTFGGFISPRIILQPMRCEKMLELPSWIAHVCIRMGAGEERYMEVLSENFDLNIHYTTHTHSRHTPVSQHSNVSALVSTSYIHRWIDTAVMPRGKFQKFICTMLTHTFISLKHMHICTNYDTGVCQARWDTEILYHLIFKDCISKGMNYWYYLIIIMIIKNVGVSNTITITIDKNLSFLH